LDFDQYAESYETEIERVAGVSVEGLAAEKARMILKIASLNLGDSTRLRALDLGCGIGLVDRHLQDHVAELTGIDVSEKSLDIARKRAPRAHFNHFDGTNFPFADERFDLVFVIGVLLIVPPTKRSALISEMMRVLRTGGVAIVMEHNPYNPVTRSIVSRCALDADSRLLTCAETVALLRGGGACEISRRYFGFLPFRHRLVQWGERALAWLPVGAQYCAFGVKAGNVSADAARFVREAVLGPIGASAGKNSDTNQP
jgi:SAM-dependent methyltransferase